MEREGRREGGRAVRAERRNVSKERLPFLFLSEGAAVFFNSWTPDPLGVSLTLPVREVIGTHVRAHLLRI